MHLKLNWMSSCLRSRRMVEFESPQVYHFMLNVQIPKIVYLNGVPAFRVLDNGEKDWIAPDGITMYMNNKEIIDAWLQGFKWNDFEMIIVDDYESKMG
jgi:hypothetical protein